MLVAYQIALKDLLGAKGSAVFACSVMNNFTKINEATGVNLVNRQSLEEAVENLSTLLKASGFVEKFKFERVAAQKYLVYIDGCVWALEAHKKLHRRDLTCPLALIAIAIVQAQSGRKVKIMNSEYSESGTQTVIET